MNIVLDNIDEKCLFYYPPVKNTVMDNSIFTRLAYSNEIFSMNGIYLRVRLNIFKTESYFNKSKYYFNYSDNKDEIDKLARIEKIILDKSNIENVDILNKLYDQFMSKSIRVFNTEMLNNENIEEKKKVDIIVKLSGIWNTERCCGLTFKFFDINHQWKNTLE